MADSKQGFECRWDCTRSGSLLSGASRRRLAGESESTSAPYDGVMSFEGRDLPEELQRFLSDFITAFQEVSEVWLFGSTSPV